MHRQMEWTGVVDERDIQCVLRIQTDAPVSLAVIDLVEGQLLLVSLLDR
jgi:hypothetical protein